jgi:hypothetical protein
MRSSGELAVELVEVTTLSALSGRKAMRSDTEPGSQGSRTLRFDSMDPVSGNRQLQYHLKVHSLICKSHSLEDLGLTDHSNRYHQMISECRDNAPSGDY